MVFFGLILQQHIFFEQIKQQTKNQLVRASLKIYHMNPIIATVNIQVSEKYKPIVFKIYENSNIVCLIENFVNKYNLTTQIYDFILSKIQNELTKHGITQLSDFCNKSRYQMSRIQGLDQISEILKKQNYSQNEEYYSNVNSYITIDESPITKLGFMTNSIEQQSSNEQIHPLQQSYKYHTISQQKFLPYNECIGQNKEKDQFMGNKMRSRYNCGCGDGKKIRQGQIFKKMGQIYNKISNHQIQLVQSEQQIITEEIQLPQKKGVTFKSFRNIYEKKYLKRYFSSHEMNKQNKF